MYVIIVTRLDIIIAIRVMNNFAKSPQLLHWKVVEK
jgi:hypothetical protein